MILRSRDLLTAPVTAMGLTDSVFARMTEDERQAELERTLATDSAAMNRKRASGFAFDSLHEMLETPLTFRIAGGLVAASVGLAVIVLASGPTATPTRRALADTVNTPQVVYAALHIGPQ